MPATLHRIRASPIVVSFHLTRLQFNPVWRIHTLRESLDEIDVAASQRVRGNHESSNLCKMTKHLDDERRVVCGIHEIARDHEIKRLLKDWRAVRASPVEQDDVRVDASIHIGVASQIVVDFSQVIRECHLDLRREGDGNANETRPTAQF